MTNSRFIKNHTCHWPTCNKQVLPQLWGCKKHWLKLPYGLRRKIWDNYRPGQEVDKKPSAKYLQVALDIQNWARDNPD